MNGYKIPAPYSGFGGKKYCKVEIQFYKFNKEKGRSDRKGKMLTFRIDDKETAKTALENFKLFIERNF